MLTKLAAPLIQKKARCKHLEMHFCSDEGSGVMLEVPCGLMPGPSQTVADLAKSPKYGEGVSLVERQEPG